MFFSWIFLMSKVGKRFVLFSLWFFLLSNLRNFFRKHALRWNDVEMCYYASRLSNLKGWNAEKKYCHVT